MGGVWRVPLLADTAPVMIWMSGTDKLWNYFSKLPRFNKDDIFLPPVLRIISSSLDDLRSGKLTCDRYPRLVIKTV